MMAEYSCSISLPRRSSEYGRSFTDKIGLHAEATNCEATSANKIVTYIEGSSHTLYRVLNVLKSKLFNMTKINNSYSSKICKHVKTVRKKW